MYILKLPLASAASFFDLESLTTGRGDVMSLVSVWTILWDGSVANAPVSSDILFGSPTSFDNDLARK